MLPRASQVAQWKRICLPMQEMVVQSLGPGDPLEKEIVTHSIFLPRRPHRQRAWWATVHGVAKNLT